MSRQEKTQRIHIVGPPRSGTTLLAALISTCFNIGEFVTDETRLWKRMPHGEAVLVTKCPSEETLARFLLPLDRRLWFIFLLRDPRDVVVSEHGSAPGKYWSDLRAWWRATSICDKLKHHPRFIVVRYEDLVRDPDKVQRQLAERMSFLQTMLPFSQFHKHMPESAAHSEKMVQAMRGLRRVSADSIGSWRRHLPRVKQQFSAQRDIGRKLIELGYEADDSWRRVLDGVRPLAPEITPLPLRRWLRIRLRRLKAYGVYLFRRYVAA